MEISDKDAAIAWRNLKEFVQLPNHVRGHVQDLDEYFRAKLAPPAPPVRCNELAQVWGMDQYKCPKCGVMWDRDEERPDCRI